MLQYGCGQDIFMRFYEIDSGDILVDGKSIKNYNRNVLRQSFGLVYKNHGCLLELLKTI